MGWYVYVLESLADGSFYKGYSSDYLKRLSEHNDRLSAYTSSRGPRVLRYVEVHDSKTMAIKRELMLKRQNRKYLLWLFDQPTNILNK